MTLIGDASEVLSAADIDHALIGAAALAVHGVARATADVDLLAIDPRSLEEDLWSPLRKGPVEVEVRRGDAQDPLAGVVRITRGEESVDVIVGRGGWQAGVLRRASPVRMGDATIPVVGPVDLVLLKLYAGGPQDLWDIHQLLDAESSLAPTVEGRLSELPDDAGRLWERVLRERRG